MRILHISWEYPPLVYGGLGRHVGAIAAALADRGNEVVTVTQSEDGHRDERIDGVRVIRVPRDAPDLPFDEAHLLGWVTGLESALTRAVAELGRQWQPEVIHAHDWMVAHTAVTAQTLFQRPIVTTVHATEAGRHQGWLPNDLSRSIHGVEHWLTNASTRVIACSQHMRWETERLFAVDPDRIAVVPNGIDLSQWTTTPEDRHRARFTYAPDVPLLVHTGRLEWEKGMHTVLDAMPTLQAMFPGIRLVVAGRGGKESDLKEKAHALRLGAGVEFVGWLPENDLHALVAAADAAIVPSLYEPFGLVALEAAALGTPVVVAASGGLAEFADSGRAAVTFPPGDPAGVVAAVAKVLHDPAGTRERVAAATRSLRENYTWPRVAELTEQTYRDASASWQVTGPPEPARAHGPTSGNLLYPGAG